MPFRFLRDTPALAAILGDGDVQISTCRDRRGRAWISFHFSDVRGEPGDDLTGEEAGEIAFSIVASKPSDLDVVERSVAAARELLEGATPARETDTPAREGGEHGR